MDENMLSALAILAYEFNQDIQKLRNVAANVENTGEKQVLREVIDTKAYIYNSLYNSLNHIYYNFSGIRLSVNGSTPILENQNEDYIYKQLNKDLNLNSLFHNLFLCTYLNNAANIHLLYNLHMTSYNKLLLFYIKNTRKDRTEVELQNQNPDSPQRTFTIEELSTYNGRNGKPSYAAVNGVVYDVTSIPSWQGGTHFQLMAGRDLTSQFNSCHGNISTLRNASRVGILSR